MRWSILWVDGGGIHAGSAGVERPVFGADRYGCYWPYEVLRKLPLFQKRDSLRRVRARPVGKSTAAYAGGRVCGNNADLLQCFAALLCRTDARALDKSLIKLLAKHTYLDGVQGVECSNHFAPTKINHLGEGERSLSHIARLTVPNFNLVVR
jgi:hypothetical protein